ncbi:MAG: DegT/DnrJ/EryC1/StrS aminotransferase family protein [Anaerolineae bacterium]|nr:DegT/DnrJ/EryC1/StrS aminotransferase family protein [Anaerolineae bacterium]
MQDNAIDVRRKTFLKFSPPNLTEAEIQAVVETLRSGWVTRGPRTGQFETEFKDYLGAASALAVNSCTAAMHLALVALGVQPGDEVITTTMTFISTVNVIEHVGARPVLVDVEPDTLTLDPARAAAAITPRTKVMMPVHYAGHPADLAPILDMAQQHGLKVIEDAAHALPAAYEGRKIGTIGDLTAFSFYATKNLTTGEGGMLTGDPDLVERARILSLHGMSRDAWNRYDAKGDWYYEVAVPGFKYNMTDIQAALGIVQLSRLEAMQQRRREIVDRYNAAFSQIAEVEIPTERTNAESSLHLYVLHLNLDMLTIDRAVFIEELKRRNIGSSVHFIPIHLHPYYRDKYGLQPTDFPVAYGAYERIVSLPLHSLLSDEDVQDVIAAVTDIVKRNRR